MKNCRTNCASQTASRLQGEADFAKEAPLVLQELLWMSLYTVWEMYVCGFAQRLTFHCIKIRD